MSRFIESIGCFDGEIPLISLHQDRVSKTFKHFFNSRPSWLIQDQLTEIPQTGKIKIRILYDQNSHSITWQKYQQPQVKMIKIISSESLDYAFKYEDRGNLTSLLDQKQDADEILISISGYITDSYYANACFWDGDKWYTPKTYLLNGVRRQHLIDTGKIQPIDIKTGDINHFKKISLINALNDLDEVSLDMRAII